MTKIEIAKSLYAAGKIGAWNNNGKSVRVLVHAKWWPLNDRLAAELGAK